MLHIGLPKTASTFLQYTIFKHAPDLIYVPRARDLSKLMKKYQRVEEPKLAETVAKANSELAEIYRKPKNQRRRKEGRPTLISHENISIGGTREWDTPGPTPSSVAARIAAWARSDDLPHRSIGVILGVRRQDQWLASRYAQSSEIFDDFGQADFEQRMETLCAGALEGSWQWLDYAEARRRLMSVLGEESVFVFPMELLADAPRDVLSQMGHFLGGVPLADVYTRAEQDPDEKLRRNVKSIGPNTWKGLASDASITLSEPVGAAIRERFRSSNEELSEAIGADLQPLGYW